MTEGLTVNWDDTLCKRALNEARFYYDDVQKHWGDSVSAKALNIQSYLGSPIHSQDGQLLGTLCAVSSQKIAPEQQVKPLLKLISALLSFSLEREKLVQELQKSNQQLARLALLDPLTELPNRRAFLTELPKLFATAKRQNSYLIVGAVDLDNFKTINDHHSHQAGDQLLKTLACRLKNTLRENDLIGRTGGDEFLFATLGISSDAQPEHDSSQSARLLQQRLSKACAGRFALGSDLPPVNYQGASVGSVVIWPHETYIEQALRLADQAMYRIKQQRKIYRS